jgi:DNA primase
MHTQGEAVKFIETCFGPAKLTNGGLNANVCCPVCGDTEKKKLAIRTDSWLAHCWVCNYKSKTIYGLLKRYKPHQADEFITKFDGAALLAEAEDNAFKAQEQQVVELPRGYQLLAGLLRGTEDIPFYARQAIKYLKGRGITERDLWYFKLGVTVTDKDYSGRIVVPSYDSEGCLNFFTSRSYKPNVRPKYFNPKFHRETVVFNELNIDWTEELTLVEGPFDLFKVNDNATCLLGKELTKDYLLFQRIVENKTPVLLCLDNDAKRNTLDTARLLYDYNISVRVLELPEDVKDPGEISREKFLELREVCSVEFDDMYYLRNIIK